LVIDGIATGTPSPNGAQLIPVESVGSSGFSGAELVLDATLLDSEVCDESDESVDCDECECDETVDCDECECECAVLVCELDDEELVDRLVAELDEALETLTARLLDELIVLLRLVARLDEELVSATTVLLDE